MNTFFRALITMFILIICSIAFARSGYVYSEYFEDCRVSSRSIFVCSDNSVVVLGNLDYNYGPWTQYLTITKLDPSGNLVWRQWMMDDVDILRTITGVDIDENDTVTFITTELAVDEYIRLWSIDSGGNFTLLSEEPYIQNYRRISFNKAMRIPNNEIVAVGKTYTGLEGLSACFYRFSATGDTLATAYYPLDASSPYQERGAEAYDLALGDNGNILITCQLNIGTASILEIDPMGNIINRIDVPETLFGYDSSITVNYSTMLAGYLIAGPFGEYPSTAIKAYLLHNNELVYLFEVDQTIVQFLHSTIMHDSGVLLCGTLYMDAALVSLSGSGELNWSWQQDWTNSSNYIIDGIGNPSTALLAMDSDGCVYWAWGGVQTQLITKLLPNGQLPVEDEVQSPTATMISAYPNPMKDEIRITIKQDNSFPIQANRIDIFNIKGQLTRSLELTKGETVWDGRDNGGKPSPKGIYFLRSDGATRQIRKIVKTR